MVWLESNIKKSAIGSTTQAVNDINVPAKQNKFS